MPGSFAPTVRTGTFMPAATFGAPQTICSGLRLADIDGAKLQLVGVRMLLDAQHLGDDDIRKVGAGGTAFLDFEAGHGQYMAELLARQGGIDEAAQPGFGELHVLAGIASGSAGRLRRTGADR